MNWLILLYFLELGYSPIYQSINLLPDSYSKIQNESILYIDFGLEAKVFDYFFIGGNIKTFMQPQNDSYMFYPIEADYQFKVGFKYENIEAGFRHQCNHPVQNFGVASNGKSYGGFEEIYIRITN